MLGFMHLDCNTSFNITKRSNYEIDEDLIGFFDNTKKKSITMRSMDY